MPTDGKLVKVLMVSILMDLIAAESADGLDRAFFISPIYLDQHTPHHQLVAGLFVVVSWISFVVPPDVIPGRMSLLITLFLVLVNIFNTVTTNTPKAEG